MDQADKNDIEQCIKIIKNGGLAVIPTDTVYGLVCSASNGQTVQRLYELKDRVNKPGPVIASSIDQLVDLGIKHRYLSVVEHYWPNQISIEIPHDLKYLNLNTGRQAFRVVNDKSLQNFLTKTGPLLTSSANLPDKPPAKNVTEAKEYFHDNVDFYLDGGEQAGEPSTLISVEDDAINVIRQGAVKLDENGNLKI